MEDRRKGERRITPAVAESPMRRHGERRVRRGRRIDPDRRVSPAVGEFAIQECERLRQHAATLEVALYRCLGCLLTTFPDEADSAGVPLLIRNAKALIREALKMETP